jgi:HD-like signal output (HDOD) protein
VTSLEATCSRLGLGVVRSTSIALAISAPFNPAKCPSFDLEYYWCSVLLTAEAASRLAAESSSKHEFEPATARAAGLLHNLGLLWLVDRLLHRSSDSTRRKPAGISVTAGPCRNHWLAR